MKKLIEKDKKDAIKQMKNLLGDFVFLKSDIDISIFVENQLEMILIHMTLSKDYNSGQKRYFSHELPYVYFKLKKAYKSFERSRWILLTINAMQSY